MYMKFTNKNAKGVDETIIFDDYERGGDNPDNKGVWVEMCPRCREKYASIIGFRADDGGSAQGFCSVHGCRKEAHYYVDFSIDEVAFENTCGGRPPRTIQKVSGMKLAEFLFDNLTPGKAFFFYEANDDGKLIRERIVMMVGTFEKPAIVSCARFGGERIYSYGGENKSIFCREFKELYLEPLKVDFRNLWLDTEPFLPCTYAPFTTAETGQYLRDFRVPGNDIHLRADLVAVRRQDFLDFIVEEARDGVAYDFQIEGVARWQRCMCMEFGSAKVLLHHYGYADGDCVEGRECSSSAPSEGKEWFNLRLSNHGFRDILVPPALGELINAYAQKKAQAADDAEPEACAVEQPVDVENAVPDQYQYVVVCYAVHDRQIASHDPFQTESEAEEFLRRDAKNTYEEEVESTSADERNAVKLDIANSTATLEHNEFVWTWEIIRIQKAAGATEECQPQMKQPETCNGLKEGVYAKTKMNTLPSSCTECPLGERYGMVGDVKCLVLGEYFTGNVVPPYKERPDECPLVEVEGV